MLRLKQKNVTASNFFKCKTFGACHAEIRHNDDNAKSREPALVKFGALDGTTGTEDVL